MAAEKTTASASAGGSAWYEPVLLAPSMAREKLQTALLLMASEDNEWKGTALQVAAAVPEPANSTFFPFFLHNIYSGLVPPFSRFFYAVLHHYGLHALHIHPNFIILMSIFAFYCEAFMG